ncbi:MAG: branched-chain amino acid ABC transporter permease [Burkholderiaceae bacterium]|nr:branched-chain amino acid ABC transporter permease [Burkholderiaceae bacterium]MEB2350357.1 branched-chain amino acid ABC transporter permease [Burkholderiaceae bacterium]
MPDFGKYGPREWVGLLMLALLAILVPAAYAWSGQAYYLTLATRIVVFALAAVGLNLALGLGGMVSLGHAMYLGIGAYTVGILSEFGIAQGYVHLAVAVGVGALVAFPVGMVCLRTSGMAFIMITLAFAQMAYFVAVGLKRFGGEDGLPVAARSQVAALDPSDGLVFYLLALAILGLVLLGLQRLIHSRFGMALQGSRINERRMSAMGFPVLRCRLLAYVLSAEICVVAGILLANFTRFVSPSYMQWSMSGELIVMVVLGGMGTLLGPVIGAASLVSLEELLTGLHLESLPTLSRLLGDHSLALVGLFVILVTLKLHRGLLGSLRSSGDPS